MEAVTDDQVTAQRTLVSELEKGLRRPVLHEPSAIDPYATDFGRVVRRRPTAVVHAESVQEVVHAVRVARRIGVPVTLRGAGCSAGGQPLGTDVVVVSSGVQPQCRLIGDRIDVSGRTLWGDILRSIVRRGRTLPVLPNFLRTTVGGTLAVGGFGMGSIVAGAQTDHVERLQLVLPDGEVTWCSLDEDTELFRHSLAGLGQLGAIERIVLRTGELEPLRFERTPHPTLVDLAAKARTFSADAGAEVRAFFGEWVAGEAWAYAGYVARANDRAPFPPVAPHALGEGRPGVARVWCDYAVDDDALKPFVELVERTFLNDALRPTVHRIYLRCLRNTNGRNQPALDLRGFSNRPVVFGLGVYCVVPENGGQLAEVRAGQRALLDACIALGGRPYLCGAHSLSEAERERIYGDAYRRMLALRDELDPASLFNRFALR